MSERGSSDASGQGARLTAVAGMLAISVLLSRVLGFVRESVLAYQLGVSSTVDAYRAAFQIPDLLNYFLAGGALSIAFIPFYTRVRSEGGDDAAARFFAKLLGTLTLVSTLATALLWWNAEALVRVQFPAFDAETTALTVHLTRIVLPAQIFFVAGGVVRALLMAHDRFRSQVLAPLLYNLGIIAGGGLLGGSLGAEGFAWGVLGGALLGTLLVPLVEVARAPELRLQIRVAFDRDFGRYLVVAAPLMLGVTLVTVDEWYDRWFGALLASGTVAALGYARILMQIPVAAVGQAIGTAALPAFSKLWSEGRRDELNDVVLATLRVGLGLALLAGAAFAALAEPVVELVYHRGAFDAAAAVTVAELLAIFSWAVPAWVTQQIAVRAFYARGDTWRPMLLGTGVAVVAIPLYLSLGPAYGARGLAFAGVFAMSVNALLTIAMARAIHGAPDLGRLGVSGLRMAAVAVLAGVAAVAAKGAVAEWSALVQLAAGGAAFGAVGLAGTFSVGDRGLRDVVGSIGRRLARVGRTG